MKPKTKKRWWPELGEKYWIIDYIGDIVSNVWHGEDDPWTGSFHTKKEAVEMKKAIEKLVKERIGE